MIGFVSTALDWGSTIPIMKILGPWRGMLAAAALALSLSPALAGDLEDGMEAYDGGDYALALAAWNLISSRKALLFTPAMSSPSEYPKDSISSRGM